MQIFSHSRRGWFRVIGAALVGLFAWRHRTEDVAVPSPVKEPEQPTDYVFRYDSSNPAVTLSRYTFTYDSGGRCTLPVSGGKLTTFTYDSSRHRFV